MVTVVLLLMVWSVPFDGVHDIPMGGEDAPQSVTREYRGEAWCCGVVLYWACFLERGNYGWKDVIRSGVGSGGA